ncbi:SpoIIE family protein phosphatase [Streptomyces chumphonensis]|uniref:SpoIIE family protein phosphatase n=1 Tax=Streptomyces chumphonensis TaxID=1214925 RepID=A0A927F3T5_9ACTN|nr:SpoIIE family protein phosphatase [Streptomyces chumphonensis]
MPWPALGGREEDVVKPVSVGEGAGADAGRSPGRSPAGTAPADASQVATAPPPSVPAQAGPPRHAETLLVIDADPAGSPPLPELTDGRGGRVRVRTARNLTEAERLFSHDVHCILLDLAQFDLDLLREVLRLAPGHAVLVLTGEDDAERAVEAVRIGAQDYLYRDELDARLLGRAIRYAVERKQADRAQRQLTESRLRAQENARLERGLLPTPLLDGSSLRFAARYRPGRSRALLGGDFYDTVRTADGTVHAMIGDVCGHGPDEAALGVELRIAWRALILAGLCGDRLLATLQQVLEYERRSDEIFATLCMVDIAPDGRRAGVCLAGHPAPLLARPGTAPRLLPEEAAGPALGLLPRARWARTGVELGGAWSLMLYTDGLIEGRVAADTRERLGQEGMLRLVDTALASGAEGEGLLDDVLADARRLNGEELADDVAALWLSRG